MILLVPEPVSSSLKSFHNSFAHGRTFPPADQAADYFEAWFNLSRVSKSDTAGVIEAKPGRTFLPNLPFQYLALHRRWITE